MAGQAGIGQTMSGDQPASPIATSKGVNVSSKRSGSEPRKAQRKIQPAPTVPEADADASVFVIFMRLGNA